ncbi:MAG: hypothetical protein L0Y58_03570 [Verrucomicrobia subdivision 3 bacterium]|nr:hypothetical protein [Limisphaerales bacterium]
MFEISKLTCVKEATRAHGAVLKMDVSLIESGKPYHARAAAGTQDAIDAIELATNLCIADINSLRMLHLEEIVLFELIEPNALAICATVHLDS